MKLNKEKLIELFIASIDNGNELLMVAKHILLNYGGNKFSSLALAEIALEEFGKAYTCLAYYSKADLPVEWKSFWIDWKSHDVKAHRAFLFEFFCTLRVEFVHKEFKGKHTLKGSFSKEKQSALYVDINKKANQYVLSPKNEVRDVECFNRIASLLGTLNTSLQVKDILLSSDSIEFKKAISDYAFRIMTENIYQQNVGEILKEMKTDNSKYNSGLEAINKLFYSQIN